MTTLQMGAIGLGLLLVFVFIGMPTFLNFVLIGFVGIWVMRDFEGAWGLAKMMPFTSTSTFEWSVIPLFVMMGIILFETGIGEQIFRSLANWLQHIAGGIAASTSVACALIGTMTGSGYATTALMANVAYPEMVKLGYQRDMSLAVCAASGTVAMLIPPSITIVIYAVLADVSIGQALLGGFIPGFLSMAIYVIMILIRCRVDPSLGPARPPATWRVRFVGLKYLTPVAVLILTIVGGLFFGVFTATEAAGMGALIAMVIALTMRKLNWDNSKRIILGSLQLSLLIMLGLICAQGFYMQFLNVSGISVAIAKLALGMPAPWITLAAMFGLMFITGMFIGGPMGLVTVPIFSPVVAALGYPLVWFVIMLIKMTECGAITPPICITVFIAQAVIKEVPMEKAYKAVIPFVACDVITIIIMLIFPQLTMFLPDLAKGQ